MTRLAAALAILASPAGATCLPLADMGALLRTFQEQPVMRGMSGDLPVEWWIGPAGTWTVLVIRPDGQACIVAAGTDGVAVTRPGRPV